VDIGEKAWSEGCCYMIATGKERRTKREMSEKREKRQEGQRERERVQNRD